MYAQSVADRLSVNMPVIAINVSKKVQDAYEEIPKGKRSKRMNNALERHFRLEGSNEYDKMSYFSLQLKIKEREEAIDKLQTLITDLNAQLNAATLAATKSFSIIDTMLKMLKLRR
jgi:flagellin-specific chaperone FliS